MKLPLINLYVFNKDKPIVEVEGIKIAKRVPATLENIKRLAEIKGTTARIIRTGLLKLHNKTYSNR